jgi:hypothetical protein
MAGWLSNGVVNPGPATVNGVVQVAPAGTYPQLSSLAEISADTEQLAGASPQTVAAFAAQIAMIACAMIHNTQTSTVHAATSNTFSGQVVTEALTTAAGAVYTFTLTNSLIAATTNLATPAYANIVFDIRSGTNTVPGMVPTSATAGAGSTVLTFTNNGTAALNGTMVIGWHLAP